MMHAHVFEKAIKRYTARAQVMAEAHLARQSGHPTGVGFSRSATIDSDFPRSRSLVRGMPMTRSATWDSDNARSPNHRTRSGGVSMTRSGTLETRENYIPPILPRIFPVSEVVMSSEGAEESTSHSSFQLCPPSPPVHTVSPALGELQLRIESLLEMFPQNMLDYVKTAHEHMQYFFGQYHSRKGSLTPLAEDHVPGWLKGVLDDVAGEEGINANLKEELLSSDDARHVSFSHLSCTIISE